jgi:hypothetical protein
VGKFSIDKAPTKSASEPVVEVLQDQSLLDRIGELERALVVAKNTKPEIVERIVKEVEVLEKIVYQDKVVWKDREVIVETPVERIVIEEKRIPFVIREQVQTQNPRLKIVAMVAVIEFLYILITYLF